MSNVAVTPGSGANVATNTVTRDAVSEVIELVNLADTSGNTGANTVVGTVNIGTQADVIGTGTITVTDTVVAAPTGNGATVAGVSTTGSLVSLADPGGLTAWNVMITGLTSGTLYFEESLDSTTGTDGNWIAVNGRQTGIVNTVLGYSTTTNGIFRGNASGSKYFRVRSVGTLTGTPAITIRLSNGVGAVFLNASMPAGTNVIGHVIADSGSTTAVTSLPAIPAGTNVIGHVIADSGSTTAVTSLPALSAGSNAIGSVTLGAAVPAGTNVIGHIIADSGSTTAVTSLPAIPAGTNVIGHVIADSGSTTAVTSLPALPTGTNTIGKVTSTNDATTTTAYSAVATTVIKGSAGRLVSLLVTGTLATANVSIYDNASAASGTVIGYVPTGTAIGTVLVFMMPAALGITVGGVAGNAAFTVAWA